MRSSTPKLLAALASGAGLLWLFLSYHSTTLPSLSSASAPQRPARASTDVPDIALSGSHLSLHDLNTTSDLHLLWSDALRTASNAAQTQLDRFFTPQDLKLLEGFPGTAITDADDALALQAYLDCTASNGAWKYDPQGKLSTAGLTVHKQSGSYASCDRKFYKGRETDQSDPQHWDVRESLKYRWRPHSTCSSLLPSHLEPSSRFTLSSSTTLPTRSDLCALLHFKYILLAGDAPTQYYLHDMLLDWTNDAQDSCYGDLYCGQHSICGSFLPGKPTADELGGRWQDDIQPFDRLALSPETLKRQKQPPVQKTALPKSQQDYWTAMRFRRTDGLWMDSNGQAEEVDPVYTHPKTGVREINQYLYPDLRRSDLVVLSKAPLPMPLKTSPLAEETQKILKASTQEFRAAAILALAVKVTETVWLPEAMRALQTARLRATSENLLVWRGNWRMQPDCSSGHLGPSDQAELDWWHSPGDGPPPHAQAPSLKQILFSSLNASTVATLPPDVHAIFYNVQAVLQNAAIRKILPRLGVPFLDMEAPMSVWRTGMLGSPSYKPDHLDVLQGASSPTSRNCLEPCIPSAGMSAEEGFIGGLYRLLQSGWGTPDAADEWIGKAFTPIRKREA